MTDTSNRFREGHPIISAEAIRELEEQVNRLRGALDNEIYTGMKWHDQCKELERRLEATAEAGMMSHVNLYHHHDAAFMCKAFGGRGREQCDCGADLHNARVRAAAQGEKP